MSETNPFPSPSSRTVRRVSRWGDRTFTFLTGLAAAAIIALLIAYVVALDVWGPDLHQSVRISLPHELRMG